MIPQYILDAINEGESYLTLDDVNENDIDLLYVKPDININSDDDFFWLCSTVEFWGIACSQTMIDYLEYNRERIPVIIQKFMIKATNIHLIYVLDCCLAEIHYEPADQ